MIPALLLKKLYTVGSLRNTSAGAQFALKNRLTDAEVVSVQRIAIDGCAVALDDVQLDLEDGRVLKANQVSAKRPVPFPLRSSVTIRTSAPELVNSEHQIEVDFEVRPFGKLSLRIADQVNEDSSAALGIPRDETDDYAPGIVAKRREYIEQVSGV